MDHCHQEGSRADQGEACADSADSEWVFQSQVYGFQAGRVAGDLSLPDGHPLTRLWYLLKDELAERHKRGKRDTTCSERRCKDSSFKEED